MIQMGFPGNAALTDVTRLVTSDHSHLQRMGIICVEAPADCPCSEPQERYVRSCRLAASRARQLTTGVAYASQPDTPLRSISACSLCQGMQETHSACTTNRPDSPSQACCIMGSAVDHCCGARKPARHSTALQLGMQSLPGHAGDACSMYYRQTRQPLKWLTGRCGRS